MNKTGFQILCESSELPGIFGLAWRLFEVNLALVSPNGETSVCFEKNSQQAPFCLALQKSNIGKHLCDECDRRFYQTAVEQLVPLRYHCHAGLTEFIVPVVRYGQLLALLQCGQVFDVKPSAMEWNRLRDQQLKPGDNPESLETLFFHNRVLPRTRQEDLMRFMELVATRLAYSPHLAGTTNRNQEILRRIANYVEANLTSPLPIDEIARSCGVSVRTLSRLFAAETGMTALDYVQERRIARACHYLTASDKTCIEVAFAVGFQSVQNFNRTFRKLKNTTPRDWRLNVLSQRNHTKLAEA